jgi:5-methylcytosine-specific restriction endonuclease McrA
MKSNKKVLVLNQSYQPITITTVKKAVTLTWRNKVEMVETSDQVLHSPSMEYPMPVVIRLKNNVRYNPFRRVELNRRNLFKRDKNTCVYCGSKENLTVDHVVPRSRGGKTTWDNVVTACHPCNNKKDNKMPEDVGLKLKIQPKQPNHLIFLTEETKLHEKWKPYLYMV